MKIYHLKLLVFRAFAQASKQTLQPWEKRERKISKVAAFAPLDKNENYWVNIC